LSELLPPVPIGISASAGYDWSRTAAADVDASGAGLTGFPPDAATCTAHPDDRRWLSARAVNAGPFASACTDDEFRGDVVWRSGHAVNARPCESACINDECHADELSDVGASSPSGWSANDARRICSSDVFCDDAELFITVDACADDAELCITGDACAADDWAELFEGRVARSRVSASASIVECRNDTWCAAEAGGDGCRSS
jgi:hypothetical protein